MAILHVGAANTSPMGAQGKAYRTPTGIPYMWESGDIITGITTLDMNYDLREFNLNIGYPYVGWFDYSDSGTELKTGEVCGFSLSVRNTTVFAGSPGYALTTGIGSITGTARRFEYIPTFSIKYKPRCITHSDIQRYVTTNTRPNRSKIDGNQVGYSISSGSGATVVGIPGNSNNSGLVEVLTHILGNDTVFDNFSWQSRTNDIGWDGSGLTPQNGDRFGHSVSVGNGMIIVGVPGRNSGTGCAVLYRLIDNKDIGSSVTQDTGFYNSFGEYKYVKTINPVGSAYSFGHSVSIGSGRIAISDLYGTGKVHVYDLNGCLVGVLTAKDGQPGDQFGYSVSIKSGVVAVGAPGAVITNPLTGIGVSSGAFYVYDRDRITPIDRSPFPGLTDSSNVGLDPGFLYKVYPDDGQNGDRFGHSICVGSGRIVVGSPNKNNLSIEKQTIDFDGAGYVYNLHGTLLNKVVGVYTGAKFGTAVGVDGHIVAISQPYADYNLVPPIQLYYTPQAWTLYDAIDANY